MNKIVFKDGVVVNLDLENDKVIVVECGNDERLLTDMKLVDSDIQDIGIMLALYNKAKENVFKNLNYRLSYILNKDTVITYVGE